MKLPSADLTRTTFAVLFLGLLTASTLWILRPFLAPTIWATMVVVATWPLMCRVQQLLWGRRALAVAVMTLALLLLLVAPLTAAVLTIAGNADEIIDGARSLASYRLPDAAPAWVAGVPVVGSSLARLWEQLTAAGLQTLLARLTPYVGDATRWFFGQVGGVGLLLLQFLLTVVVAALMYASGEAAARLVRRFAGRLAGARGVAAVQLAGGAIRGVAMGVGVTALVQSVLAGLGMAVAGVPYAGLLTGVALILCIAQIGPLLVLAPATAWVFWTGDTGWGVFLAVWTVIVGTMDNFLRPVLIRMGADLPLLLIFSGVIGGLLAFGLVGIFVGPVVLAVAYTLLEEWMGDEDATAAMPASPAPGADEPG